MPLEAGQHLAHYRLLDRIGAGGMGVVWRALDTTLEREVAVKVLPQEVSEDPEQLRRLEQEAKTLARLNHPNIVTIFSVEQADGPRGESLRFITMELVQGTPLNERIPGGGLPLGELIAFAEPIADALAAAHDQGVIHRDLKPANVMVGADGTVKVLDLGLAKLDAADPSAAESLDSTDSTRIAPVTRAGTVLGTVPYMSPEQARGQSLDHRSDIYSFGVLLHQMASGALPFSGRTPADTVSAILRDEPPSLSSLRPELPGQLSDIVQRCMMKSPDERFETAAALRRALDDAGSEISGERSGGMTATQPAPRPWLFAGAAILALVALFGAAWWVGLIDSGESDPLAAKAPEREDRAMIVVFPFENLGDVGDAYFAAGVAEEISSRLAGVGSIGVISRASAVGYAREGKTMAQIGEELGVDYVLDGTVRWAGGGAVRVTPSLIRVSEDRQLWSQNYDETLEQIFAVQSRIAEQVLSKLDLQLTPQEQERVSGLPTENLEAYEAYRRGIESRAASSAYSPENIQETLALLQQAVALDPDFALAWAALADEHSWFYHLRYDTTEARRELARAAVERAMELDPTLPEARLARGLFRYRCYRDYEAALIELSQAALGLPNSPVVHQSIGAIQRRRGDFEEAARQQELGFRLNPRAPDAAWDLGVTYICLGRHRLAESWFDRAISLRPDDPAPYALKALVFQMEGDLPRALAVLGQAPPNNNPIVTYSGFKLRMMDRRYRAAADFARAIQRETLEHTTLHRPRNLLLATALEALGEAEEARTAYEDALAELDRSLVLRADDARVHVARGLALAGLKRREEAVAAGRRAVALYPSSLDAFHGPHIEYDLMRIYLRLGDGDNALATLESLLENGHGSVISVPYLRASGEFDPLREDPRFERLLRAHEQIDAD